MGISFTFTTIWHAWQPRIWAQHLFVPIYFTEYMEENLSTGAKILWQPLGVDISISEGEGSVQNGDGSSSGQHESPV